MTTTEIVRELTSGKVIAVPDEQVKEVQQELRAIKK